MTTPGTDADNAIPQRVAAQWPAYVDRVRIADAPAYSLARHVPMAPGTIPVALSMRLTDLVLRGLGAPQPIESSGRTDEATGADGQLALHLRFPLVRLEGRCVIESTPDPLPTIDHGGTLMPLTTDATVLEPVPGGSAPTPPAGGTPGTEQEAWLNQARGERTKLAATPNGQALLALYNQHNQVLDTVFRTNTTLQTIWPQQGATRQMAADTSAALTSGTPINSPTKTYANGLTYNETAFLNHLAVAVACYYSDPQYNPDANSLPDSPYTAALKDILSFQQVVGAATSNDKTAITPMTPDDVYSAVETHSGSMPALSDAQAFTLLSSAPVEGGTPSCGPAVAGNVVLDEADRAYIRSIGEAMIRRRAEVVVTAGEVLFEGACTVTFGALDVTVDLAARDDSAMVAEAVRFSIPAFDLEIEDAAWHGPAAELVRRRVEGMRFVGMLLHEAVADALRSNIAAAAEQTVRLAMPGGDR